MRHVAEAFFTVRAPSLSMSMDSILPSGCDTTEGRVLALEEDSPYGGCRHRPSGRQILRRNPALGDVAIVRAPVGCEQNRAPCRRLGLKCKATYKAPVSLRRVFPRPRWCTSVTVRGRR